MLCARGPIQKQLALLCSQLNYAFLLHLLVLLLFYCTLPLFAQNFTCVFVKKSISLLARVCALICFCSRPDLVRGLDLSHGLSFIQKQLFMPLSLFRACYNIPVFCVSLYFLY